MKDMALQGEVLKMPVTSLKIEGRKKTALYVAAAVDYYRRILDGRGDDAERAENIRQIFRVRGRSFISTAGTKTSLTAILSDTAV